MVRILSVVAAVLGIILFAVFALTYGGATSPTTSFHELGWGLVAFTASLGLFELSTITDRPL
jgi:Na+-transporting NADH:ubiquinone oxidoreductase subunit NqrB